MLAERSFAIGFGGVCARLFAGASTNSEKVFWFVIIARQAAATATYGALEDEWLRLARRASILRPDARAGSFHHSPLSMHAFAVASFALRSGLRLPLYADLFEIFSASDRDAWCSARQLAGIEAPRSLPTMGWMWDTTRCRRAGLADLKRDPSLRLIVQNQIYGSNCMDCRRFLCRGARGLGSVPGKADRAQTCPVAGTHAELSPTATASFLAPSPSSSPLASPEAAPQAVRRQPRPFAEKTETLRNSDVELHLTNRGGGIAEAVLLNHMAEDDKHVTLNSGITCRSARSLKIRQAPRFRNLR